MKNIAKIENLAPIFGDRGDRKASDVKDLSTLKNAGVNFETYTLRVGETLKFPKFEDMKVKQQPVQAGSDTMVYLVACMRSRAGRDDAPYWFNLNSLAKRDVNNVPVHEEWYELGNCEARLQKLADRIVNNQRSMTQSRKAAGFKIGDKLAVFVKLDGIGIGEEIDILHDPGRIVADIHRAADFQDRLFAL